MFIQPALNVTIRCARLKDIMTDNFYINGAMPAASAVPNNKTFVRSVREKVSVIGLSDGFGDSANAPLAAQKTLNPLKRYQNKFLNVTAENQSKIINSYLEETNSIVNSLGSAGPGNSAGSSLAMFVFNNGVASAVNIGSSRAYSFKYGRLNRLSCDDTEAERLLSVGAIRREEVQTHPAKDYLTNYVGMSDDISNIKPHISAPSTIEKGDVYLLCSNGLTDTLTDDRIAHILSLHITDDRMVSRLINEAIAKGADDNISVVLIRVGGKNKLSRRAKKRGFRLVLVLAVIVLLITLAVNLFSSSGGETPQASPTPESSSVVVPTTTPQMILR